MLIAIILKQRLSKNAVFLNYQSTIGWTERNTMSIIKYMLLAAFALICIAGYPQQKDPLTVHDYISERCRVKTCVDQGKLKEAIDTASTRYQFDKTLLMAVIEVESNFDHRATNTASGKSIGLTQVQLSWHKDKFASRNYYAIHDNIMVGGKILSDCLIKHNGNARKALMCYNGYSKLSPTYAKKVLTARAVIKKLVDLDHV